MTSTPNGNRAVDNKTFRNLFGAGMSILNFEMLQISRQNNYIVKAPFFYVMMITLFPLALGPDPALIEKISTGVLILSLLLACLFPVNNFFESDYDDKTLEQVLISHIPFGFFIFLKMMAHWLMAAGPLVLLSPVVAVTLQGHDPWAIFFAVIPASMLFVLLGIMGAALTVGTKQGGILLALLVLPLYIPVVIFTTFAAQPTLDAGNASAALAFLYAGLAISLPVIPLICSGILKMNME